jgi:hypothetical protein
MPAFKKVAHATPAEAFCGSLDRSQRNHLRALLHHEHACRDLKRALGIAKTETISHAQHATGLARRGETIRLFKDYADRSPANLTATDTHATAGKAGCSL